MSGKHNWVLVCDNPECDSKIVGAQSVTLTELRESANTWGYIGGKDYCGNCKETFTKKYTQYYKDRYNKFKKDGVCPLCLNKLTERDKRHVSCLKCRVAKSTIRNSEPYTASRYYKLKMKGLCVYCGKVEVTDKVMCEVCSLKRKNKK